MSESIVSGRGPIKDIDVNIVSEVASNVSLSSVAASASSITLLAANSSRKGATVFNDSTVNLYLKFGTSASTSSFTVRLFPYDYYEIPFPVYTNIITGIWDSATGNARVTELT